MTTEEQFHQGCTATKKNSESRPPKSGFQDFDKLTRLVLDIKAEMGSMRKAMINSVNETIPQSPIKTGNRSKPRKFT